MRGRSGLVCGFYTAVVCVVLIGPRGVSVRFDWSLVYSPSLPCRFRRGRTTPQHPSTPGIEDPRLKTRADTRPTPCSTAVVSVEDETHPTPPQSRRRGVPVRPGSLGGVGRLGVIHREPLHISCRKAGHTHLMTCTSKGHFVLSDKLYTQDIT